MTEKDSGKDWALQMRLLMQRYAKEPGLAQKHQAILREAGSRLGAILTELAEEKLTDSPNISPDGTTSGTGPKP